MKMANVSTVNIIYQMFHGRSSSKYFKTYLKHNVIHSRPKFRLYNSLLFKLHYPQGTVQTTFLTDKYVQL